MKLTRLKITGFRNVKPLALEFGESSNTVALVGLNGHGKTNCLEAIFLLGISKSFRTRENQELIGFDQEFCRLEAEIIEEGEDNHPRSSETHLLEVIVTKNPPKKTLKFNGMIKRAVDYIGHLKVVFFSPDDMNLIHAAPSNRRRYLDLLIAQLDHRYLETSLKYQATLKQRNALLKQMQSNEGAIRESRLHELDFWDQTIATHGLEMIQKRYQWVAELNRLVKPDYQKVSGGTDDLKIDYESCLSTEATMDDYRAMLQKNRTRECLLGNTEKGPHRDDLVFYCNQNNMASFASRGEWRSLILTLKFAEIELIKAQTNDLPVLLLDDVFSELDDTRQRLLFKKVSGIQTFITTTHEEFLGVVDAPKIIYQVKDGEVL